MKRKTTLLSCVSLCAYHVGAFDVVRQLARPLKHGACVSHLVSWVKKKERVQAIKEQERARASEATGRRAERHRSAG